MEQVRLMVIWFKIQFYDAIQSGMLEKDYYAAVRSFNSAMLHGIIKIGFENGYFNHSILIVVLKIFGSNWY